MTALGRARFLRQANALIGVLTSTGLCLSGRPVFGLLFLLLGAAHLWAEIRHWPYRTQDSVFLGFGLLLNLYVMTSAFLRLWTQGKF